MKVVYIILSDLILYWWLLNLNIESLHVFFLHFQNETFHPLKELEESVHRWPWRYFHSYLIQTSSGQLCRHWPRERNRNEAQTQILAPWLLDQSKVSVFQWVKEGSFTHWKTLSPIESLSPIEGFPWLIRAEGTVKTKLCKKIFTNFWHNLN